jgi:hypothetical protein
MDRWIKDGEATLFAVGGCCGAGCFAERGTGRSPRKGSEGMDPLLLLGVLAFVIGCGGVLILIKGKRKRDL